MRTVSEFATGQLQVSVQNIVTQMLVEMDELAKLRAELGRRRRRLLRLRYSLRQEGGRSVGFAAGGLKSPRLQNYVNRTRAKAQKSRRLHNELRRACRVAFLEAGGVATPDQIYSLIVRRSSFSFADIGEEPAAAITRTLRIMAQAGEARCITSDLNCAWKFTRGEPTDPKS